MRAVRRRAFLLVLALAADAAAALAQEGDGPSYETVFYDSGGLRIQAYLYRPEGDRPFPLVIYNHGSRIGRERTSVPFRYVGICSQGAASRCWCPSDAVTASPTVRRSRKRSAGTGARG